MTALSGAFAIAGCVWFLGVVVLRLTTIRIARAQGRRPGWLLISGYRWMTEKGSAWAKWGRATIAWVVAGPPLIVLVTLLAAWLTRDSR